jgi:hypothetical protein
MPFAVLSLGWAQPCQRTGGAPRAARKDTPASRQGQKAPVVRGLTVVQASGLGPGFRKCCSRPQRPGCLR